MASLASLARRFVTGAIVFTGACSSNSSCPDVPGPRVDNVTVTITDSVTRARVCDAQVSASDGHDSFQADPNYAGDATACVYKLAIAGGSGTRTFDVSATAPGHQAGTGHVDVTFGECGDAIGTESVSIALTPL